MQEILYFLKKEKSRGDNLGIIYWEQFIDPREEDRLDSIFDIEGEDVGKNIKCTFSIVVVPDKEVCE